MSGDKSEATIWVDGASRGNPGPAGAGVVICAPGGQVLQELSVPIGRATNNVAEYTALLAGLRAAGELGLKRVAVRTDSELLHRQLAGIYRVKNPSLQRMHAEVRRLMRRFEAVSVTHVRREGNAGADRLANLAAGIAAQSAQHQPEQESLDV